MSEIERVCISTISACNLMCRYCYFSLKPASSSTPKPMRPDQIATILKRCNEYGYEHSLTKPIKVNFVGNGEPLLNWEAIRSALGSFCSENKTHQLRFYMVTNGLLLDNSVIKDIRQFEVSPSISLDGPPVIHDSLRVRRNGSGSYEDVMKGVYALKENSFDIVINTTVSRRFIEHIEDYFDFIARYRISKVIFGRLVDVSPRDYVSTGEFYNALRRVVEMRKERNLDWLEIGNIEAYERALKGNDDRVCTMFGSTCGAGFNNIIYMHEDVFPCGRMFGNQIWRLGGYADRLADFPSRMSDLLKSNSNYDCKKQDAHDWSFESDCLLDKCSSGYDCESRRTFVTWLSKWFNENNMNLTES